MALIVPAALKLQSLARYVCPLYSRIGNRSSQLMPQLIGTAIPLRDGNRSFLITARHVVEEAGETDILVLGQRNFIALLGDRAMWVKAHPEVPDYDVAAIELHDQLESELSQKFLFSTPEDIGDADLESGGLQTEYAIIGYPHSKNPAPLKSKKLLAGTCSYQVFGKRVAFEKLKLQGKNSLTHFALEAPKRSFNIKTEQRQLLPKFNGMSGGGIWKLYVESHGNSPSKELVHFAKLVGVFIERHTTLGLNALVCTRIAAAIATVKLIADRALNVALLNAGGVVSQYVAEAEFVKRKKE